MSRLKIGNSPTTIKRAAAASNSGRWQEFIDREQSSVDQLIQESFVEYCKTSPERTMFGNSLTRRPSPPKTSTPLQATLPRRRPLVFPGGPGKWATEDEQLPPGIQELETLYAPMKNLMYPLPNARKYSGNTMPAVHNWDDSIMQQQPRIRDEDQESEIFCLIPPPLPPVQSHAVLEKIPRTPMSMRCSGGETTSAPPLPPKRTNSRLSLLQQQQQQQRPIHLSVSSNQAIYANAKSILHRSSLMSTGSSENSSGSSDSSLPSEITPVTPNSEGIFSWPSYADSNNSTEHRSVSQIGDVDDCSVKTSNSSSGVYVRPSRYKSLLYKQHDSSKSSSASSPYIDMKGKMKLCNSSSEVIYAQPVIGKSSSSNSRPRSSSTSRIQELMTGRSRRKSSSSSASKSKSELRVLLKEVDRKRHFRVGLNLFNSSKPDLGIDYLSRKDFLELSPSSVAKFLYAGEGLSKDKIGEYLCQLQNPFSMKVLSCFMQEFDFSGQRVDKSLRKMLQKTRVPGEAQKIERMVEEFGRRYHRCNPDVFKNADAVTAVSFAVMMLNTDLHTPNLKEDRKMSQEDFISNLKKVEVDLDLRMLKSVYKGVKKQELLGGADHVLQTQLIQRSLVNSKLHSQLAEPHRRLVCLCRLYEVTEIAAKEPNYHQRDLFLFNDLLVMTKQSSSSSKSSSGNRSYGYRDSFPLRGTEVTLFHTQTYHFGIQLSRKRDGQVLLVLNAGSEEDRYKFVMDLQESISEMELTEQVLATEIAG